METFNEDPKPGRLVLPLVLIGMIATTYTFINRIASDNELNITPVVEEVIDEHYKNQINQLGSDEKNLKNKIIKFREDELHHKDIAYNKGATKKGLYSIMDKIIKTGSKVAITISEKI